MRKILTMNLSGWSVVACALVGALSFSGANAQLRIEITRGVDRPVPMAIVPFSWQGPTGSVAPFDVSGLISADLGQSGRFDPIEQRDMVSRPTRPADVDFDDWRIVEVDVLVIGGVAESGPGQYEIVFQLFDVLRGEQMLGFRLTSTENELRAAGHRIADMIFGKHTDPSVDRVHITVGVSQATLDFGIGRDVSERFNGVQPHIDANLVVVRQTMISTALDVQGCEVKATCSRWPEQEVAHVVNKERVNFLSRLHGSAQ